MSENWFLQGGSSIRFRQSNTKPSAFLALATPIVVFFGRALWLGYLGMIG